MIKNYLPHLIFMLLVSNLLVAQTEIEQQLDSMIASDVTLTKNNTYIVNDHLQLSKGAILTIEEGVTLKSKNNTKIVIVINSGSRVHAAGSYENPIKAATALETNEKPIILMKSSVDNTAISVNDFIYKTIENPTVLVNEAILINSKISSIDNDF